MTLPSSPPKFISWAALVAAIERGEQGWRVFALQSALNARGASLATDGFFGEATLTEVLRFQRGEALVADGIAGQATQGRLIQRLGTKVHVERPEVPDGLMRGLAEGEGANVLAATNWSVPGGVDCGTMQYRVYGPPYAVITAAQGVPMQLAFDPLLSMRRAAREFADRWFTLGRLAWASRSVERAKRCAVLAHNWPAGADYYARYGHAPDPSAKATWVPAGTLFPDGAPVVTRQGWCEFYAMGGPHGEGRITKYVRDW